MEATSFVSRARTAFHSAAAKAERVFTDIKSDLKHDRDCDDKFHTRSLDIPEDESLEDLSESKSSHESKNLKWRPTPISLGRKQDWQDRFRNIRIGRKGVVDETGKDEDSKMSFQIYDDNLYTLNEKNDAESKSSDLASILEGLIAGNVEKIPPSSVIKQLGVAIENGKKVNSMKDFLVSSKGSSPVRERVGLSLSAVKSLVLREKEEQAIFECGDDEKVCSVIQTLFDAEADFLRRKVDPGSETTSAISLARDMHAAPPESFVVKVAEVIGSFKTMKKMALFWCRVVEQLRRLWYEELHIAGIALDQIPDLHSCLLYQQLQVINCCISRKRRHNIAKESLDTTIREAGPSIEEPNGAKDMSAPSPLYARISTGEFVLRLGADRPSDLYMLETGEQIFSPVTQECPLLTEETIKETEEFVLRTGSVGAGCSQLLSDMQAFKAANPGCILEDFVRWHSPPDWTEAEECSETDSLDSSSKGQLSRRMQKGNLWRELWEASKPVPAVNQTPLFDGDLAVEGILNFLEDIPPLQLFEQLFVSLLALGLGIAEASIPADSSLSKLFYECKDYVVAACQGSVSEKVDDLYQVYETIEMMLLKPDDILKIIKQGEEMTPTPADEPKRRFRRLIPSFGSKDKNSKEQEPKNPKNSEDASARQSFASFFDSKSSLFSKKPPKPGSASPSEKTPSPDENEWTIV